MSHVGGKTPISDHRELSRHVRIFFWRGHKDQLRGIWALSLSLFGPGVPDIIVHPTTNDTFLQTKTYIFLGSLVFYTLLSAEMLQP